MLLSQLIDLDEVLHIHIFNEDKNRNGTTGCNACIQCHSLFLPQRRNSGLALRSYYKHHGGHRRWTTNSCTNTGSRCLSSILCSLTSHNKCSGVSGRLSTSAIFGLLSPNSLWLHHLSRLSSLLLVRNGLNQSNAGEGRKEGLLFRGCEARLAIKVPSPVPEMWSTKRAHMLGGVHEDLRGVVHVRLQVRRQRMESERIFGSELKKYKLSDTFIVFAPRMMLCKAKPQAWKT